jgi:hypothetical protein
MTHPSQAELARMVRDPVGPLAVCGRPSQNPTTGSG